MNINFITSAIKRLMTLATLFWISASVQAQSIPAIHLANSSGIYASDALNSAHTFTTSFEGVNDVTITANDVPLPGIWTDNYSSTGPGGAGDNPSYITGFVGNPAKGTGNGEPGVFEELQTYNQCALTFNFSIPLDTTNRIMISDIDNGESYSVLAFSGTTPLPLTGWKNQMFSGETGANASALWASWKPTGGGPYTGTFTANTPGALSEPLDILTPAAGQSVTKIIFTQTSGSNAGDTASLQILKAPVADTGSYTFLMSAISKSATVPQGVGYGTLTVGGTGGVIMAGALPDGEAFSAQGSLATGASGRQVFVIDKNLAYPSVTNAGSGGFLWGTLTFAKVTGTSDFNGTLGWIKPQQNAGNYPASIIANLSVIGSHYTYATGKSVLPGFTSGTLAFTDGKALSVSGTTHLNQPLILDSTNQFTLLTSPALDKLSVVITPSTGVFKGSFVYPGQKTPTAFGGVFFQDQMIGSGFFLGPNGSGTVSLSTKSPAP